MVTPKSLRNKIIEVTHGTLMTGHESTNTTKERIMTSYWWPGIDDQINKHISKCDKCQRTNQATVENKKGQKAYYNVPHTPSSVQ
jgi:hypothetical protein